MPLEESVSSSKPAMAELKQRLSNLETKEGRLKGLSFNPSPDDVIVCTSPKCGTTWMQQVRVPPDSGLYVVAHSWIYPLVWMDIEL